MTRKDEQDVESGSDDSSRPKYLTTRVATLTALGLFKALMGTGLLAMPKAMKDTGTVLFPILLLLFATIAQTGCILVTRTIEMIGEHDTDPGRVGDFCLGAFGKWLAIGCSFVDSWGATVAFLRTVYDTSLPMLQRAAGHRIDYNETVTAIVPVDLPVLGASAPAPDEFETAEWMKPVPVIFVLSAVIFPATVFTQVSFLDWVNSVGTVSLVACLFALFAHAATQHPSLADAPVANFNMDALLALSVLSYTYDGLQMTSFPFYRDLPPLKDGGSRAQALAKICAVPIGTAVIVNFVIAIVAFATFRDDTKDNLLNNLPEGSVLIAVIKISFAACILLSIPITIFEAAHLIRVHIVKRQSRVINWIVSFLIVGSAALVASLVPNIYKAFAYVGASSSMTWTVVIPPLFYIKTAEKIYPKNEEAAALQDRPDRPPPPSKFSLYASWFMLIVGTLSIPLFVYAAANQ